MPKIVIKEKEGLFIQLNYLQMSSRKIADQLGVSKTAVLNFMRKKRLVVPKETILQWKSEAMKGRTSFTKEDDEFIKANYLTMPVKRMAKELGRSGCGVNGRMNSIGLVIPKEIIESRKDMTQFRKGQGSWNKGLKQENYMPKESIEKTKATRFQKGNKPHNTKYDGCISERADKSGRKYKYVRISESNWQLLQRKVWEDANGTIPDKHKIIFKDGNSMNCKLDNLMMITEAELMGRNSIMRYPEELRNIIRLNARLLKTIKITKDA